MARRRRRAARRPGGGGRVRGLHVDRLGVLRSSVAGTISFDLLLGGPSQFLKLVTAALPARRAGRRAAGADGARPHRARARHLRALAGLGLRAPAAEHVLPVAAAGDLVGRADRAAARRSGSWTGALVATGAIFTGLAIEGGHPAVNALLTQPAVLSVPIAFAVMVLVSLGDRRGRREAGAAGRAMHPPEGLGLGFEPEPVVGLRARRSVGGRLLGSVRVYSLPEQRSQARALSAPGGHAAARPYTTQPWPRPHALCAAPSGQHRQQARTSAL